MHYDQWSDYSECLIVNISVDESNANFDFDSDAVYDESSDADSEKNSYDESNHCECLLWSFMPFDVYDDESDAGSEEDYDESVHCECLLWVTWRKTDLASMMTDECSDDSQCVIVNISVDESNANFEVDSEEDSNDESDHCEWLLWSFMT